MIPVEQTLVIGMESHAGFLARDLGERPRATVLEICTGPVAVSTLPAGVWRDMGSPERAIRAMALRPVVVETLPVPPFVG
jgi:hypothetical protein